MTQYDYEIKHGDDAFLMRRNLHDSFGVITSGKITITNNGGSELLAATDVTIASATTLAAQALAGENTATVSGGTWEPGDLLRIEDSDDGGPEIVLVESFDSSSKILRFEERLQRDHSSGADVTPRWVSYTLDASDVDTWVNSTEGMTTWGTWNTDDLELTNSFIVGKRSFALGGNESDFARRYPHYYKIIDDGAFGVFERDALQDLIDMVGQPYGKDFVNLVSTSEGRRPLQAQIAYLVALGQGNEWEKESVSMAQYVDQQMSQIRKNRKWFDSDEDKVKDDEENQHQNKPLTSIGRAY